MTIELTLPWPDPKLSPNARAHWAAVNRAKRMARDDAYRLTLHALRGCEYVPPESGPIRVELTFCPAQERKRDRDNFQAACKAALDGIAEALGINDSRFYPVSDWGEKRKPGAVVVRIGAAAPATVRRGPPLTPDDEVAIDADKQAEHRAEWLERRHEREGAQGDE